MVPIFSSLHIHREALAALAYLDKRSRRSGRIWNWSPAWRRTCGGLSMTRSCGFRTRIHRFEEVGTFCPSNPHPRSKGQIAHDRQGARWTIGCPTPVSDCRLDYRIERTHGDGHIAWMRGNARVADTHNRMLPRKAPNCAATAAGLALVARLIGVVEIGAARSLQQIAGRSRHVAELTRRAGEQSTREQTIVAPHTLVRREICVAHQRSDAQSTFRSRFDLIEREPVDVDEMLRRFDLELHEIEQIGAAGDELGSRPALRCCRCLSRRSRTLVGERFHVLLPATSAMASTMLEYAAQRQMLPLIRSRNSTGVIAGRAVRSALT